jgi:hypothetical protein
MRVTDATEFVVAETVAIRFTPSRDGYRCAPPILRQLLCPARKRNLATEPRQNNPTGKSPKTLSSPSDKNIPLNPSGKSVI